MEDLRDDTLMPTIDDRAELDGDTPAPPAEEARGEAETQVEEDTNVQ